jgi:hypothetical protein
MTTALAGRRPWLVLATLLVGLVTGCGQGGSVVPTGGSGEPTAASSPPGGSPSSATSSPTEGGGTAPLACDVVTSDMIDQALGATVGGGISQSLDLGGSTCEFKDAGILIRVFPNRDASFLQSMKATFGGSVELPGVGDGAFYSQQNATLMLLKGTTAVQVQAPNQNDQAKLAALAIAIAARL